MSLLAANGYLFNHQQIDDRWFEDSPADSELSNWLSVLAVRFGKTLPNVERNISRPIELARVISSFVYAPGYADTMLVESDINYNLSFDDANEIPRERRAEVALLLRDGYFSLNADLTFRPNMPFSRARILRLFRKIYEKKKWMPEMQSATAGTSVDGKLMIRSGKSEKPMVLRPDVFLFREFGGTMYPVREVALLGGEKLNYQVDALGAVKYLEVEPTETPTTAERMSPWTIWNKSASGSAVQSRLSRYVRGIGTLYDINVKKVGYSRRPVELEIIGSNGIKTLKGGKIRSALRLPEQLFVMNKRYAGNAVASYTFTGRGWGHGVGMCQYGAFGLAKMGVKYDEIVKHYYSNVDLTQAY